MFRRAAGLLGLAMLVLALAGCADFDTPPTGSQAAVIGAVHVHSAICLDGFGSSSGNPPRYDCDNAPGTVERGNSQGQLLVGYLIPSGSTAPATLTTADLPGTTLSQSQDYADYLNATQGTLPREVWVGYMSDQITQTANQVVSLDAAFSLPAGAGSGPYSGPFATEEAVGDRVDGLSGAQTLDPARALDCTEATTECLEDSGMLSVDTRDLSITAPASTTVVTGQTATLPFDVAFAGIADPSATFAVRAGASNANLTATSTDSSLTPASDSTATENVTVAAAATMAPGTYQVTLTAVGTCADASNCTRSATASVVVTAPPATTTTPTTPNPVTTGPAPVSPVPTAAPLRERLVNLQQRTAAQLFHSGVKAKLSCNQACAVVVKLLVNQRALVRGRQWKQLFHSDVVTASTEVPVEKAIYNLRHAGTRTIALRVPGTSATSVLPWAGAIAIGVSTYGVDLASQHRTAISRHWNGAPGLSIYQRLRARNHRRR
jgi:hypothetical protein